MIGVAVGLLAAACGGDDGLSLDGTSWVLTELADAPAVAGRPATLTFAADGVLNGTTGCNNFGGSWSTDGDGIELSVGPMTLAACADEALSAQEGGFLVAIGAASTYTADAESLTLRDGDGTDIALLAAQSTGLAGTEWTVISYNTGTDAVTSVISGTEITVAYDDEGRVSGNGGCNNYNGPYEVDGATISQGPLGATRMLCNSPEGVDTQEALFLAAMESAATFTYVGIDVEMRTADDQIALRMTPAG